MGNKYRLHWDTFNLDVREKFFTVRAIVHWNSLPRDVVDAPSLEVFRIQLDRVLNNLI